MSRASDTAYLEIRRKVLSGELGRNRQLTERELADSCGVSRTPVREALRRLEAEMLVERSETQRWFIREWDADPIEELFTLRAMIESHAARRAASRITPAELAELERINNVILTAIDGSDAPDISGFLTANQEFHRVILAAARSDRLATMRRVLYEQSSSNLASRRYDRTLLRRSHADHEEMLFAFRRHDADWARLAMDNHIHHALMMALRHGSGEAGQKEAEPS